jgi:hypothetical protein
MPINFRKRYSVISSTKQALVVSSYFYFDTILSKTAKLFLDTQNSFSDSIRVTHDDFIKINCITNGSGYSLKHAHNNSPPTCFAERV